jgi:hypothetical protein
MRCGTVGGADQQDYLTFQLKSGTTNMALNFTGQVRLRVTVGNLKPIDLTPNQQGSEPFVKGVTYLVEVTPLSGNAAVPWTVTLVEK